MDKMALALPSADQRRKYCDLQFFFVFEVMVINPPFSVSECLAVCLLCSVFECFWVSSFDVYGECVSHLSMSQRAGPGPIYYVSWPKGSRLGEGFHRCGDKRCNTCRKGMFGEGIRITATNKDFTIRQSMTCKTSNVIYCVTCTKCWAQYIGETGQEIHQRQAGHHNDINRSVEGLPYVKHFNKCGVEH